MTPACLALKDGLTVDQYCEKDPRRERCMCPKVPFSGLFWYHDSTVFLYSPPPIHSVELFDRDDLSIFCFLFFVIRNKIHISYTA